MDHVHAVADAVEDRLKPIAYLHDVVEDTPVTLDELASMGFSPYVLAAVDLLTHKAGDNNLAYWGRIRQNSDAVAVKRADIADNQASRPSPYAQEKYAKALKFFGQPQEAMPSKAERLISQLLG